jgi:hypothetical protein
MISANVKEIKKTEKRLDIIELPHNYARINL